MRKPISESRSDRMGGSTHACAPESAAASIGYRLSSVAVDHAPIQLLDATIGGRRHDVTKDALADAARTAALFRDLGLAIPAVVAADTGLTDRQKQLNKIAAAIDISDPNHAIFMTILADLVDGRTPNWGPWDAREAANKRLYGEIGRRELLDEIHKTFFAGAKPQNSLYLGAGGDVANPLRSTGAQHLTLVDTAPFPLDIIKEKIRVYYNAPDLVFTEESSAGKVTKIIACRPHSDVPLQTIDLRQMGYGAYFAGDQTKFDTLFDKDSWLRDAEATVVHQFAERLKTAGIWISNYTLGGELLRDLFDDAGIVDRTALLDPVLKNVSFGFDTVRIYQKAEHYRAEFFAIVYDYASTKALRNSLTVIETNAKVDFDTMVDLKAAVTASCARAVAAGAAIVGFAPMAAKILAKTAHILALLEALTLPEDADF